MNRTFIIAEAGVNHNGNIELAKQLVDEAVFAKVDAVKFQTFIAEKLVSKNAHKADYQINNTDKKESQLTMIKNLELSFENFMQLQNYCSTKNIIFLSSPFDLESIDFLASLNLPFMKVPSGEINNLIYLRKIGRLKTKVILSTGMSTIDEIQNAIDVLVNAGTQKKDITLLHCNTEYPTPMQDVNLKAMETMKQTFGLSIGYSDHTKGIEIPIAAVAMGAEVIEKHFTLDRNMEGPDHKASLSPEELSDMVKAIRNIEAALGDGLKVPSKSEIKNKEIARKSVHTAKDLKKGHLITEEDLAIKRPGNGISPMLVDQVIGKYLIEDLEGDALLKWEHLQ